MSADKKWPKDFMIVCKRMADPPESFEHRQRKHHTIRLSYRGKQLMFSFPQTPSCHRSLENMMETFAKACNDNGISPDDKVFRGKQKIRAAYRRRNKKVVNH